MKRLLAAALSVAAFACAGPAAARADQGWTPTCGQNTGKYATATSITHPFGAWDIQWTQNCGSGGTVEWELQYSTDGGKHWLDTLTTGRSVDYLWTTPSGDANQVIVYERTPDTACQNSNDYRLKVYDARGSTVRNFTNNC